MGCKHNGSANERMLDHKWPSCNYIKLRLSMFDSSRFITIRFSSLIYKWFYLKNLKVIWGRDGSELHNFIGWYYHFICVNTCLVLWAIIFSRTIYNDNLWADLYQEIKNHAFAFHHFLSVSLCMCLSLFVSIHVFLCMCLSVSVPLFLFFFCMCIFALLYPCSCMCMHLCQDGRVQVIT